ncbi:CCA tRNA nucleotidyltransferase [Leptospira fluminis]|uniref:CCA tRNA nucleotidyltransferase n=1 Tax=Leptospira fluminis TaxID=2484979 RepID=A0A4R9GP36_9LEPT|nr:CCA tRNA nucleotidyltransferase [Leptospira fluminis]TGK17426.1 CCA tRNA nucleotidyltransferase [Leptospira fluminis]
MSSALAQNLIRAIPSPYLEDLLEISRTVRSDGGEAYLVGGSVRDLVLGKLPHEFDLAVSSHPDRVQKLFRRVVPTGIKHGTVTVLLRDRSYELTTFRKEEEYKDGRRPEQVSFGVGLSEDLKRRDFTMNALALDLLDEKLIDEHDGLRDISEKRIRTIGIPQERFREDGLRPVRAIRFVSALGFRIDPETEKAIEDCRPITAKVSAERIHDEFLKILKTEDPSPSLKLLKQYRIFELFQGENLYKNAVPDWEEKIHSLSKLAADPDRLRISYFLKLTFGDFGFSEEGKNFCKTLRFSNQKTKDSLFLYETLDSLLKEKEHLFSPDRIRKKILHPCAQYSGRDSLRQLCSELASLWTVSENSSPAWSSSAEEILRQNPPLLLGELKINGTSLRNALPKLPPQKTGEVLRFCLEAVLQEPEKNSAEELSELVHKNFPEFL